MSEASNTLHRVRDAHIREALNRLNAEQGLIVSESGRLPVGYRYWADIKGDGRNSRSVWQVVNTGGGVARSHLDGKTMRDTLCRIESEISAIKKG